MVENILDSSRSDQSLSSPKISKSSKPFSLSIVNQKFSILAIQTKFFSSTENEIGKKFGVRDKISASGRSN